MAEVLINETYLTDIADAIRNKNSSTTTYKPKEMAAAINAIESGGSSSGGVDIISTTLSGSFENSEVTNIRNYCFYSQNLTSVSFPNVVTVDEGAFYYNKSLNSVSFPEATSVGNFAFGSCPLGILTYFPKLENISDAAFNRTYINSMDFSNIKTIGAEAFTQTRFSTITFGSGLTTIGDAAFANCTSLNTVTFEGTPTSISSSAFMNCSALTTINVPWAEGAVANAPWGATSAAINYNSVG